MFRSALFPFFVATNIFFSPGEVLSASTVTARTHSITGNPDSRGNPISRFVNKLAERDYFCASHSCQNQARCLQDSNGFLCQCKDGFTGVFCESAINSTPSTTSGNKCVDSTFIKCSDSHVCGDPGLAKYCPLTCKLCTPCEDSPFVNCIKAVCADPGLLKYCPVTCDACDTVLDDGCIYRGKMYKTGENWSDGCDYNCTCVDGSTGRYNCVSLCFTWSLPKVCSYNPPKPGGCCPTPNCPPHVKIVYPPGH